MKPIAEHLDLIFDPLPPDALSNLISENVINLSIARTGVSDWHPVGFFLKSPRGEWLGGLTGSIWGGWLHVSFVWVSETLRGQGLGTRLMDAAETMARERGAIGSTLETHTFQAPEFYRKRGYTVFGQLDDYPRGHGKLFLSKRLDDTA